MITVYGFGQMISIADASPFVLKVYTYLKMAGIEYQSKAGMKYLSKSPKGKLPFIDDNGAVIGDSELIIQHLQKRYNIELDNHLDTRQQAQKVLFQKALDECFYWFIVYGRWINNSGFTVVRKNFFNFMPPVMKQIAPLVARQMVKGSIKKQGLGRHSEAELILMCDDMLKSLSDLLGNSDYFFNNQPSSFDAIAYAHLAELIEVDLNGPFNQKARSYDNLVRYCKNIHDRYFVSDK
ncbi:glutathione S-transferase C-terminal domain-containing protein [Sessilibacter sp. MAH4]